MPTRIIIPEPCSENWNEMTPVEKGRHCALCVKTVVDFTSWPLADIASYLRKHSSSHVCGRFRNSQLNVDIPYSPEEWVAQVAGGGFSLLQRLALIFLLAFGFLSSGCTVNPKGEPRLADSAALVSQQGLSGSGAVDSPSRHSQPTDTLSPMIMGEIALPPDTSKHAASCVHPPSGRKVSVQGMQEGPQTTAGAPMMVIEPDPPVQGGIQIQEDPSAGIGPPPAR